MIFVREQRANFPLKPADSKYGSLPASGYVADGFERTLLQTRLRLPDDATADLMASFLQPDFHAPPNGFHALLALLRYARPNRRLTALLADKWSHAVHADVGERSEAKIVINPAFIFNPGWGFFFSGMLYIWGHVGF